MRRIGLIVTGVVSALALTLAGSASATILEKGTFHDEFSERVRDFCVDDLTARLDTTVDGRFLVRRQGADQLAYYQEHLKIRQVITNVATREFVTEVDTVLSKDHRVINNGDGTLTITVLATGNGTLYGSNGKAIARNPGQVRFQILLDHGGTPRNPFDDEFLEFLGIVKGSTGRSDDFCAAIVDAIG